MLKGGHSGLLKVDITNAFNSVPFGLIEQSLKQLRVHKDYVKYILTMLANRHADVNVELSRGVPQGDPLSMLLFVVAINPLIRALEKEFGENNVVAYADDILIAKHNGNFTEEDVKKL